MKHNKNNAETIYYYPQLREQAKRYIYKKYPKHSAYRSLMIGKEYKKLVQKKYGSHAKLYYTNRLKKNESAKNLKRWLKENWRNEKGSIGYVNNALLYRPTKRISKQTPLTWTELTPQEIKNAMKEKKEKGRITRFRSK